MPSFVRPLTAGLAGAVLWAAIASAAPAASAPAPGGPGTDDGYLGSDKSGLVTSTTTDSKVWATVQKEGGLGEVYFPDLAPPSARALRFVVSDSATKTVSAGAVQTRVLDAKSLTYAQTATGGGGRWKLITVFVTDPSRATVLASVRLSDKGR